MGEEGVLMEPEGMEDQAIAVKCVEDFAVLQIHDYKALKRPL